MMIHNHAVEPNEHSLSIYRAAIENLPHSLNDDLTVFELINKTFEEFKERKPDQMKYDMVHFIHSLYYVDMEQVLVHCYERELKENGQLVCLIESKKVMCSDVKSSKNNWKVVCESDFDKVIKIADKRGWKHEECTQEFLFDATDVFDETSEEGNLLLDFITHTMNFRATADKEKVEETLEKIEDQTTAKDGKRLGKIVEGLILIFK